MIEMHLERVDALPDPDDGLFIAKSLGFLITRLLDAGHALLHAEYRRGGQGEVAWYVRRRNDDAEGEDVLVATLPAGIFSSMVARLAVTFGIDHTSAGAAHGAMTLEGRRYACDLFLSKCRTTGYWVRVYAREEGKTSNPTGSSSTTGAT
jgi:hypothetical protein